MEEGLMIKVLDVRDNRSKYMDIAEKSGGKKLLASMYDKWDTAFYSVGSALIMNNVALQNHVSALRTPKIDPYIAGGAANGALGLGAGLATGVSAGARNAQIDNARSMWGAESVRTTMDVAMKEGDLKLQTETVLAWVKDHPDALEISRKYQDEKRKEFEQQKINKAIQQQHANSSRVKGAAIGSLILAVFITIFVAIEGAPIEGIIFVFLCAWVIGFITLLIKR